MVSPESIYEKHVGGGLPGFRSEMALDDRGVCKQRDRRPPLPRVRNRFGRSVRARHARLMGQYSTCPESAPR